MDKNDTDPKETNIHKYQSIITFAINVFSFPCVLDAKML